MSVSNITIPVFVVHHNKLTDRKEYMLRQLGKYSIDPTWVEAFPPETLTIDSKEKRINKNEYSLFLKFKSALEQGVATNYSHFIIFEDDVVLTDEFVNDFPLILKTFILNKGDLLMLGDCCNIGTPGIQKDEIMHWEPNYTTRCGHAILYTRECAEKIIPKLVSPLKGYDHKLNDVVVDLGLKSYYLLKGLEQITQSNNPLLRQKFTSSVQPQATVAY